VVFDAIDFGKLGLYPLTEESGRKSLFLIKLRFYY
jgi:hypothetical protein